MAGWVAACPGPRRCLIAASSPRCGSCPRRLVFRGGTTGVDAPGLWFAHHAHLDAHRNRRRRCRPVPAAGRASCSGRSLSMPWMALEWLTVLAIAASNTAGPLLAAHLLRRTRFHAAFDRKRDFLLLVIACGMAVSASLGVAMLAWSGALTGNWLAAWLTWWGRHDGRHCRRAPLLLSCTLEEWRARSLPAARNTSSGSVPPASSPMRSFSSIRIPRTACGRRPSSLSPWSRGPRSAPGPSAPRSPSSCSPSKGIATSTDVARSPAAAPVTRRCSGSTWPRAPCSGVAHRRGARRPAQGDRHPAPARAGPQ